MVKTVRKPIAPPSTRKGGQVPKKPNLPKLPVRAQVETPSESKIGEELQTDHGQTEENNQIIKENE